MFKFETGEEEVAHKLLAAFYRQDRNTFCDVLRRQSSFSLERCEEGLLMFDTLQTQAVSKTRFGDFSPEVSEKLEKAFAEGDRAKFCYILLRYRCTYHDQKAALMMYDELKLSPTPASNNESGSERDRIWEAVMAYGKGG